jgi:hypothetical protein
MKINRFLIIGSQLVMFGFALFISTLTPFQSNQTVGATGTYYLRGHPFNNWGAGVLMTETQTHFNKTIYYYEQFFDIGDAFKITQDQNTFVDQWNGTAVVGQINNEDWNFVYNATTNPDANIIALVAGNYRIAFNSVDYKISMLKLSEDRPKWYVGAFGTYGFTQATASYKLFNVFNSIELNGGYLNNDSSDVFYQDLYLAAGTRWKVWNLSTRYIGGERGMDPLSQNVFYSETYLDNGNETGTGDIYTQRGGTYRIYFFEDFGLDSFKIKPYIQGSYDDETPYFIAGTVVTQSNTNIVWENVINPGTGIHPSTGKSFTVRGNDQFKVLANQTIPSWNQAFTLLNTVFQVQGQVYAPVSDYLDIDPIDNQYIIKRPGVITLTYSGSILTINFTSEVTISLTHNWNDNALITLTQIAPGEYQTEVLALFENETVIPSPAGATLTVSATGFYRLTYVYKNTSTGSFPNTGTQEIQVTSSLLPGTENGITDAMKAEAFANRLYFYDACSADGTLGFGSIGQFTTLKGMITDSNTLLANEFLNDFAYGDSSREGSQTLSLTALEKYQAMVSRYQVVNPPLGLNDYNNQNFPSEMNKYAVELSALALILSFNTIILLKKFNFGKY